VDVAFDDGFWATVINGSTLRLIAPTVNLTVEFYGDVIECCAVSRAFKIAVCGTVANHIVLVSLFAGEKVGVVDIGLKPVAIAITEGWGFIIVHAVGENKKEFLVVLDVNGRLIRKVEVPGRIRAWSPWRSLDEFDHLLIATTQDDVLNIEAFSCAFADPISHSPAPVIGLAYFTEIKTAFIVNAHSMICVPGDARP
jgi:hypothetical protein